MSYVYIQSEPRLWTVGFYDPSGKWQPESDHGSSEAAANRVALLNGGPKDAVIFLNREQVELLIHWYEDGLSKELEQIAFDDAKLRIALTIALKGGNV